MRAVLDEMIEEAGGIPAEDRRWARSVLGLDDGDLAVALRHLVGEVANGLRKRVAQSDGHAHRLLGH